jgi:hypothetical protein
LNHQEIQRLAEEERQLDLLERIYMALEDPWFYLTGYPMGTSWTPGESQGFVYTLDEHDPETPLKRYPNKEYLWHVVFEWFHNKKFVCAKSRQLMISWTMIALHEWEIKSRKGALNFFVNKKEQDAMEMIRRGKVIYHALPTEFKTLRPLKLPESGKEFEIKGTLSRIKAIPQGGDVLRLYTATSILMDEAAFQEQAEESYTAAKPTISGGGRISMISTANGKNFFYDIYSDHDGEATQLMKGVRAWNNKNGFRSLEVHYSADPDKDPDTPQGKVWYENEKKGSTPEGWDREMEINFTTGAGRKIFKSFNKQVHTKPLKYNELKPLYVGWDFGYGHPAVVWAQINDRDQLCVLREMMGEDIGITEFAKDVLKTTEDFYPKAKVRHFCDPAGTQQNDQTTMPTIVLLRKTLHINFRYQRIAKPTRIEWIRRLMMLRTTGEPGILFDADRCPILVEGCEGAYVSKKNDPDIPEDDGYFEHPQDCLQYIVDNIFRLLGLHRALKKDEEKKLTQGRIQGNVHKVRNKFTKY